MSGDELYVLLWLPYPENLYVELRLPLALFSVMEDLRREYCEFSELGSWKMIDLGVTGEGRIVEVELRMRPESSPGCADAAFSRSVVRYVDIREISVALSSS
jgi:hypothetical protein